MALVLPAKSKNALGSRPAQLIATANMIQIASSAPMSHSRVLPGRGRPIIAISSRMRLLYCGTSTGAPEQPCQRGQADKGGTYDLYLPQGRDGSPRAAVRPATQ